MGDIVRKPRGGWIVESAAKALDGLTAVLLNLIYNDDWSNDARGKIMLANPDCRKESIAVLKKMDKCAVAVINADHEFATATENSAQLGAGAGGFGLRHGLEQLKRLMGKYNEEYAVFSENGYGYRGYESFSNALSLVS